LSGFDESADKIGNFSSGIISAARVWGKKTGMEGVLNPLSLVHAETNKPFHH
jgi:hypothetical protein